MPQKTSIEWTDYSSQLIRYRDAAGKDVWACAKTSPGCARCYSEAIAERFGRGGPFNLATVRTVTPYFSHDEATKIVRSKPISGKRVFIGDMTDCFGEWVPDDLLDRMFAVFAMRPDVTFQVLTKRAERMARYFNGRDSHLAMTRQFVNFREYTEPAGPWPLPNVHLGVSCEDQARADERIPYLLSTPAAVRFLSVEPMLGEIDIDPWLDCGHESGGPAGWIPSPSVDWTIAGGESGRGARPCDVGWIRSVVQQCRLAQTPVFVKQLGANLRGYDERCWRCGHQDWGCFDCRPGDEPPFNNCNICGADSTRCRDAKGGDIREFPEDLRVRQFPAARAGQGVSS